MPTRADRRALHGALSLHSRIADPRATMPILTTVHIIARRGSDTLALTTTDLNSTLTCTVPAEVGTERLDACLPAKTLARMLKPEGRGKAGSVTLDPLPDHAVAVCTDNLNTKLAGLEPQDFPAGVGHAVVDDAWQLAGMWPADKLRAALEFVLPAASTDVTRPNLCTVLLSSADVVATDGHRLHRAPSEARVKEPLLLRASAAQTLCRILGACDRVVVATAKDIARFRCGAWQLDTKTITEKFPPWQMVVPKREYQSVRVSLEARMLADAVSRVMRTTGQRRAKVRVNGSLALSTWASEVGEADVVVPTLTSNHKGDELVVGLDLAYVRDAVADEKASAELGFGGELDPVRVDLPSERLAVIMPLRV